MLRSERIACKVGTSGPREQVTAERRLLLLLVPSPSSRVELHLTLELSPPGSYTSLRFPLLLKLPGSYALL